MFDWFFNRKRALTARGYLDKKGGARVQVLDTREPEERIKLTLLITSDRSLSVADAREVLDLLRKGCNVSDEFDAKEANWHD